MIPTHHWGRGRKEFLINCSELYSGIFVSQLQVHYIYIYIYTTYSNKQHAYFANNF